jgi:hypothetical protein
MLPKPLHLEQLGLFPLQLQGLDERGFSKNTLPVCLVRAVAEGGMGCFDNLMSNGGPCTLLICFLIRSGRT